MSMQPNQFPLSLTVVELDHFNRFWMALPGPDRKVLENLLASATDTIPAVDHSGHPLPYQTFLLSLLIAEHKEVQRLKRMVEEIEMDA